MIWFSLLRDVARGRSWVAHPMIPPPPPPLCEIIVPIIQVAKTRESEGSACNKSLPVLNCCLVIYARWNLINLCSYLVGLSLPPRSILIQNKSLLVKKKPPGCRHANLVSTLGVMQCDPPPPRNSFEKSKLRPSYLKSQFSILILCCLRADVSYFLVVLLGLKL